MAVRPRVLVGGIWHETNSFSPIATDSDSFRRYLFAEGDALIDVSRGTNTEVGGMINAAGRAEIDLIPSVWAGAVPSGMIRREALDDLVGRICKAARGNAPLDGVLLALHGAMVADGIDEADAHVVQSVRDVVGPDCPIVVTIDYHANVSQPLVVAADVLIGYQTLPHVDMADRGREAVAILAGLISGAPRPAKAFRKLPLLTVPQMQGTADHPMREIMALRESIALEPGILACSVVVGFPYCDIPHLGFAVLVYGDAEIVDAAADRLAHAAWSRRAQFRPTLLSPPEAVAQAMAAHRGPIFLGDPADNVAGGSPGDGTTLLRAMIEGDARDAACVIWDPHAAAAAAQARIGGRFQGPVGGRTMALYGDPVIIEGIVSFADEVSYKRDSSWMTGQPANLGLVATIRVGGVAVIVTSERAIPLDTMHLRIAGVTPEQAKMVTLKCGSAWSSAFGAMAAGHCYVDTPGICTSNLERMPYTRLTQDFHPLAPDVVWP